MTSSDRTSRMQRWRLILGSDVEPLSAAGLNDRDAVMDAALAAIYDPDGVVPHTGEEEGTESRVPNFAKWLVDVRSLFPEDIVTVIQADAIERKGLAKLLFEPEIMHNLKPDIAMVETLLALKGQIPEKSREAARQLVRIVVNDIVKRMELDLRKAVSGALNKKNRSPIGNLSSIDWNRTIRNNLKNFDPRRGYIIPEKCFFFERSQKTKNWTVVLDIDQSGSMRDSVIYASVMGSIFAGMPMLETYVVAFDNEVSDLTDLCSTDPVDMLFGLHLGGETDINISVAYCRELITNPRKSIFILLSDLHEGGVRSGLLRRLSEMREDGITVLILLALTDKGEPDYDRELAQDISKLGIACFSCTPDRLPELVEAAIKGEDLARFDKRHTTV